MKHTTTQPLDTVIYNSIIGCCQNMQQTGTYVHESADALARRLSLMVSSALLAKKQKQIYDAMPVEEDISTGRVAALVNMPVSSVAVQLQQIYKSTLLLSQSGNRGKKKWRKIRI